jgi:glycosyltransferase involved in cell wall biosynthesis
MNIAVISYYSPIQIINEYSGGKGGGMGVYSLKLALELARQNNSVTLFKGSDSEREEILSQNLRIRQLETVKLPPFARVPPTLMKEIMKETYDLIHIHQLSTSFAFLSCLAGKFKRTPSVVTDHGGGEKLMGADHLVAKLSGAFAAVSKFSLRSLLRMAPKKKSEIIYGGVDQDLFHPNYDVEKLRSDLNLNGSGVILSVGRILPHKGIDVLVRALHLLPPNVKLLVVGSICDFDYFHYLIRLSQKCRNRIVFLGEIHEKKLPQFYNLCDVFVQPSVRFDYKGRYYSCPELLALTKLEAMACGKPVVVSDVGGLPELVNNGGNGYIVKSGDEKELAQRILQLLEDHETRRRMGSEGSSIIRTNYTWESVARRFMSFCNCLVE